MKNQAVRGAVARCRCERNTNFDGYTFKAKKKNIVKTGVFKLFWLVLMFATVASNYI